MGCIAIDARKPVQKNWTLMHNINNIHEATKYRRIIYNTSKKMQMTFSRGSSIPAFLVTRKVFIQRSHSISKTKRTFRDPYKPRFQRTHVRLIRNQMSAMTHRYRNSQTDFYCPLGMTSIQVKPIILRYYSHINTKYHQLTADGQTA